MKILNLSALVVLALAAHTVLAQAENDGAYLDPAYKGLIHPRTIARKKQMGLLDVTTNLPSRSDVAALMSKQSVVKSQGARGTCSIFSATALLESMMIIREGANPAKIDLSEEWLEHLITRQRTSDGSTSNANFYAYARNGATSEQMMPYIGEDWTKVSSSLKDQRCGLAPQELLVSCQISHYDPRLLAASDAELTNSASALYAPEFAAARSDARAFRQKYLDGKMVNIRYMDEDEAKRNLLAGIPVTLDIDFFYGAWNHRVATNLGINRNMEHWAKGIIGYPEPGSKDYNHSHDEPAGHSVLLVGYDDKMVVTTTSLMEDGTERTFTYRGVYYFKNSWGTASFGVDFNVDGKSSAGYGMITQRYAHQYGQFFSWQ